MREEEYSNSYVEETPAEIAFDRFINVKQHVDYQDVIKGMEELAFQEQEFNTNAERVTTTKLQRNMAEQIAYSIIEQLNNANNMEIKKVIPNHFEQQNKSLGIVPSLFDPPAQPDSIRFIHFRKGTTKETEKEIQYTCEFVAQKNNVKDVQMVLKAVLVMKKEKHDKSGRYFIGASHRDIRSKRKNKNTSEKMAQQVYVVGFLSA